MFENEFSGGFHHHFKVFYTEFSWANVQRDNISGWISCCVLLSFANNESRVIYYVCCTCNIDHSDHNFIHDSKHMIKNVQGYLFSFELLRKCGNFGGKSVIKIYSISVDIIFLLQICDEKSLMIFFYFKYINSFYCCFLYAFNLTKRY